MKPQLVFVYNADSGLFNTVSDIAHKILSPSTYSCQLCQLTHSYFSVKQDWVSFLEEIDADCEFLHRDELEQKYGLTDVELPTILKLKNDKLEEWMNKNELNNCRDIESLKNTINQKLSL
ncbi:MAG: hypothetical protein OEZ33_09255 [Gammaproteobacteria bacterium]|nr:hypothetical protein [Gammaproteobacteria bacterium]MDH5778386.1 hypothetical protein [Gammaproteobacteria bacterium]